MFFFLSQQALPLKCVVTRCFKKAQTVTSILLMFFHIYCLLLVFSLHPFQASNYDFPSLLATLQ